MRQLKPVTYGMLMAGLMVAAGNASAASEAELQAKLSALESEIAALKAEVGKVQEIDARVAKVEKAAPAAGSKVIGNRVFFRGGYSQLIDDRSNGAFTDMNNVVGALSAAGIIPAGLSNTHNSDDGWYFGAGFDFLLSRDTLGLLPGTWALAELGLEYRDLGSKTTHTLGPVAECLIAQTALNTGNLGATVTGFQQCAGITGNQHLSMLTVSASPKLKFFEGSALRPWIIPAGLDLNVISPPSDSTNYLDIGVQFAGGVDYEILPGITLGADFRYHLAANTTDPDYNSAAVAAAAPFTLNTKQNNDTWTAGITLGIGF
ncbi:MAG: hypothetical protein HY943_08110 [Gammaproteobacteria bacterium]|nr:hypothetical protein [Gammaproteobacteria bacterium]